MTREKDWHYLHFPSNHRNNRMNTLNWIQNRKIFLSFDTESSEKMYFGSIKRVGTKSLISYNKFGCDIECNDISKKMLSRKGFIFQIIRGDN